MLFELLAVGPTSFLDLPSASTQNETIQDLHNQLESAQSLLAEAGIGGVKLNKMKLKSARDAKRIRELEEQARASAPLSLSASFLVIYCMLSSICPARAFLFM